MYTVERTALGYGPMPTALSLLVAEPLVSSETLLSPNPVTYSDGHILGREHRASLGGGAVNSREASRTSAAVASIREQLQLLRLNLESSCKQLAAAT